MKRHAPLLGIACLVFLGWYSARYFGPNWWLGLLAAVLGVYAVVSVFTSLFERHVRREIDVAEPGAVAELRRTDADFDEFVADCPRVNECVDWGWRAADTAVTF